MEEYIPNDSECLILLKGGPSSIAEKLYIPKEKLDGIRRLDVSIILDGHMFSYVPFSENEFEYEGEE